MMDMAIRKSFKQCEPDTILRKEESFDYFPHLSDDILFNILIFVPVELLRYKFKYICKRWFNIITHQILFDQAYLIIQQPVGESKHVYRTRLLNMNEGNYNLRVKEQYLDIPCKGLIRSWCNELLLITDPYEFGALRVYNFITKIGSSVPPCSKQCNGHVGCRCGLGLAFDILRGEYKVVHVSVSPELTIECEVLVLRCELSSFNFSKWKTANGPSYTGHRQYYWDDPVSVEGRYFHWDVHSPEYIVSMDTVKERFRKTHLPECSYSFLSTDYYLVEMGGFLCLIRTVRSIYFAIWILKDFQSTVWEKLYYSRDLSYYPSEIYPVPMLPVPIASLKNGSNIIFRKTKTEVGLFGYNVECDNLSKLEVQLVSNERCLVHSTSPGFESRNLESNRISCTCSTI